MLRNIAKLVMVLLNFLSIPISKYVYIDFKVFLLYNYNGIDVYKEGW